MGLLERGQLSKLEVSWLGRVPYADASKLQTTIHAKRVAGDVGDTLLLLEHPHTYTVGRRGTREEILWDAATLRERGVVVTETDRGGRVTYHGPGQLVGYPIVALGDGADLVAYLRRLEDVIIATLRAHGVEGARDEGNTGVWVGDAKIAAIGVRVTRGVAKHGFAINVRPDLSYFGGIVPCGIFDRGVTSIERETDSAPDVEEVARSCADAFASVFAPGVPA